jgi:hypothetical protein
LVAKSILRPDTTYARDAVDGVDKVIEATSWISDQISLVLIVQKPRRHAGPPREDSEGQEVTNS